MGLTSLIVFGTVSLILKDSFRLRLMLKKTKPASFSFLLRVFFVLDNVCDKSYLLKKQLGG